MPVQFQVMEEFQISEGDFPCSAGRAATRNGTGPGPAGNGVPGLRPGGALDGRMPAIGGMNPGRRTGISVIGHHLQGVVAGVGDGAR